MDEGGADGEGERDRKRDERRQEERESGIVGRVNANTSTHLSLTRISYHSIFTVFSLQYIREDAAQAKKSYEDKYQSKVSDDHYFLSIVT